MWPRRVAVWPPGQGEPRYPQLLSVQVGVLPGPPPPAQWMDKQAGGKFSGTRLPGGLLLEGETAP